jgi:hypothetical protein
MVVNRGGNKDCGLVLRSRPAYHILIAETLACRASLPRLVYLKCIPESIEVRGYFGHLPESLLASLGRNAQYNEGG